MEVGWSPEAADDFEGIVRHIQNDNSAAARDVSATIYESISSLSTFPSRGRSGRIHGTRELVLAPLPWLVVCRMVRIYHGAQNWP
jgi:plasmid stabilization system protein ParE